MKKFYQISFMRWWVPFLGVVAIAYFAVNAPLYTNGFGLQRHSVGMPGPVVLGVMPNTPAAFFRPGDVLILINGWPTSKDVDWRWFFPPSQQVHELGVLRNGQVVTVAIPTLPAPAETIRSQIVPYVLALVTWAIGAVVLFFSPLGNAQAWRVGNVVLGLSVGLASLVANASFTPGGRVGSEVLLPIICAGFVEMAFYPRALAPNRVEQGALRVVYGVALLLSVSAVIEIFVLAPLGLSNFYSSYRWLRVWIGACLIVNPIIIVARYLRAPRSPVKQQLRILLVCTLLGVLPVLFLTILPPLVIPVEDFYAVFPFWEIPMAFLVLVPLAYAYVVYRHKFLGLDVFFTRTLTLFLLGFIALAAYGIFYALLHRIDQFTSLEPLPSALFVVSALIGAPTANAKTREAAKLLLYGQQEAQEQILSGLAASLTRAPELPTLRQAVREIVTLLEARQAALWLPDEKGDYQVAEALRVGELQPIAQTDLLHHMPAALVTRTSFTSGELQSAAPVVTHQLMLAQYSWIEVLLPLKIGSDVAGLLALGPRVPDGMFTAFQLDFVQKAGRLLAMAAHTTRLFDQVRAHARAMMEARTAERSQIAREIHDGPLQELPAIALNLDTFSKTWALTPDQAADLVTMAQYAQGVGHTLRNICASLRPPVLSQGIAGVVRAVTNRFSHENQIAVITETPEDGVPALGAQVTEAIYHITTESLNNISKHAQAKQVQVRLQRQNGQLELQISDDGKGFPQTDLSLAALARSGHFGLVGMHEWAKIAGGNLEFTARDGGGTVLLFEMPLRAG